MKTKNIFLVFVCFLFFFPSKKIESQVHFLVFGGFNTSKIITEFDNKQTILTEAKKSFNFGGGFRIDIGRVLYLQPEVYITRKGGLEKAFRQNQHDSLSQNADLQSLDMPVMIGLRLFEREGIALRAYGGPVVSFLQDPQGETFLNGVQVPWGEMEKTHVFSMQFGAGLDLKFLTFDVRYEYAFSPMLAFEDFKTKHKILYFTLGFKIF